ncbi:MAG: amidohydrolase family protein [Gemmatimonadetes bacterium]|nr:amidohydrolase family protein [Gemmatimonadota bacterium]
MKVCDPHFHLWDIDKRPNPNLGSAVEQHLPRYVATDYLADMQQLPPPMELVSSVHVETVVGQMEGGAVVDTLNETRFVSAQMNARRHPGGIVAYVHLARDTALAETLLREHAEVADGRLRGVRMILNHHPDNPDLTWPQVERGDFLTSAVFKEGIALLGEYDFSFDLQCNPHQLMDAAATFADLPQTPVILNHLGSFHDGEAEPYEDMWRDGMRALAALPHVCVKLSMLFFCAQAYHLDEDKEEHVRRLVREVIDMFGADRCMFASNYPVDRIQGIDVPTLYGKFSEWTSDWSEPERAALFHDTAARVYRVA